MRFRLPRAAAVTDARVAGAWAAAAENPAQMHDHRTTKHHHHHRRHHSKSLSHITNHQPITTIYQWNTAENDDFRGQTVHD